MRSRSLLRRKSLGRWLCAAWLGFHVILSLFHSPSEVAVHAVLFIAIANLLFRPSAAAHFRDVRRAMSTVGGAPGPRARGTP